MPAMELELVPKEKFDQKVTHQEPAEAPMVYKGPERRKQVRRVTVDRREMVRFESKPDRRHGGDRRIATKMWDGRDL
jgi:hypothetical protein